MVCTRNYFSKNYTQARECFIDLARRAGAQLDGYELSVKGPGGETLTTDIAWLGDPSAKRILVVQSGVHGVEAFAGSAIQCRLLRSTPVISEESALVLVHVINPYGMAWQRRVNGSNVDLNRNCLGPEESYSGAPAAYEDINKLINPTSPPYRDGFLLKALYRLVRNGMAPLRQAIARGQYEYPAGLFYGGSRLQQEPALLQQWLREHIISVEQLMVIDIHTGLGRFGEQQIYSAFALQRATRSHLEKALDKRVFVHDEGGDSYLIKGGVSALYKELFGHVDPQYLTVEFGTLSLVKMLSALREENRHHFYSGGSLDHWAKKALMNASCPDSSAWKEQVVSMGGKLVGNALALLCRTTAFGPAPDT